MPEKERIALVGPRPATDGLIETWIANSSRIREEDHEIALATINFGMVGTKTIALIMPKIEGPYIKVLPGDRKIRFTTPKGHVNVNPVSITEEQEVKLALNGAKKVTLSLIKEEPTWEDTVRGGTD